jgi:putative colanic acid biosynthesis acetyltransferase WcaF
VHIYETVRIAMPWNLRIGDWSALGDRAEIYNLGPVLIGRRVTISQRAHLCAGTHDYTDEAMPLVKKGIRIGDSAWICADAFVGPGVTVEEGAVLAARGVAVKDIPAWKVCGGNPARVIKDRVMRS